MMAHPADIFREIAARIAFIELAALALSERAQNTDVHDPKAWVGLYYVSNDIKRMLTQAAIEAEKAA